MRELLRHVDVVDFGCQLQTLDIFVLAAHNPDRMIVIAVDRMQGFHSALGAEVSAAGTQVVVVEVPDHGGPGVVEHPLNDAGGLVLVATVGLVHGAHAFIGLHLRLRCKVFHVVGLAVAVGERFAENADGFEFAAARVIIPDVIDRPQVVFADHRADALDGRNSRSHAGFRVEAVSAAAASGIALFTIGLSLRGVDLPVAGRDIFIWPGHLDATVAGDAGLFSGGRGDNGVGPEQFFLDVEVHLLNIRRRRIIAAIQPHHQAGMAAQTIDLIAQGLLGDFEIRRLPTRPAFPEIAAAPSGHDENALAIGQVKEFLSLELAFQANRVEPHIADVAKFGMQALRIFTHHQVGRPAPAANQNILAVDVEGAPTDRVEVGGNFANAELSGRMIADRAIGLELHA